VVGYPEKEAAPQVVKTIRDWGLRSAGGIVDAAKSLDVGLVSGIGVNGTIGQTASDNSTDGGITDEDGNVVDVPSYPVVPPGACR